MELNAWQQTDEEKKSVVTDKKAFHISKKRSRERSDSQFNKKNKFNKVAIKQSAEISALK